MEYGLIFHGTRTVKYYCKNMKYRINITRKMVPITRRASFPNKKKMLYFLINNKPILIRSKLAASLVQNTFSREAVENEGGEEETSGGYFYCYFYWYFYRSG